MVKKILDHIQKYHMIEEGDTIVAGISGGADSVCLLFVLLELQKQISFKIEVVHINHGIRQEAVEDAAYVEELCRQREIPFYLIEEDVKKRAKESGRSEEEEGRMVRYEAFAKVLGSRQGKIAVAHNSNDRAETMLFHLFRGSGLAGAAGIRPVNGNIIRPLLCVERREIEKWLLVQGIDFCTDHTNAQDIYTRNRIRHHILNYAENYICQGTVANMNRGADQFMEAEEYLARQTMEAVKRCVSIESIAKWKEKEVCHAQMQKTVQKKRDPESINEENALKKAEILKETESLNEAEESEEIRIVIKLSEFLKEDRYLQGRMLLFCLQQAAGSRKDLTYAHIQSIKSLFAKPKNGQLYLPYGIAVYKKYDLGMIERRMLSDSKCSFQTDAEPLEQYEVSLPKVNEELRFEVPGLGIVEITAFFKEESQNIPEKTYTKWFDYDKITKSVIFRTKRPGDYLTINQKMGKKSLQDYFVNEKIPKDRRSQTYLIADGSHIIWVPGYRISEYYKITEKTGTVLQIRISEKISKEERSHCNG